MTYLVFNTVFLNGHGASFDDVYLGSRQIRRNDAPQLHSTTISTTYDHRINYVRQPRQLRSITTSPMDHLLNMTRAEFDAHNRACEQRKGPLTCSECGDYGFTSLHGLHIHKTTRHRLSKHCHMGCRASFRTDAELQGHQWHFHWVGRELYCKSPDCTFSTKRGLLRMHEHIDERHIMD